MIGKVQRGKEVGGLISYLFGPGRHNEHTDAHVVAHWSGLPEQVVAGERGPDPQLGPLIADLRTDLRAGGLLEAGKTVWHCSVSIPAGDGLLSDAQWREVAEQIVERVGLEDGHLGAVRWVAVRHGLSAAGNDHIHIAATLAGRTDLGDITDRTFLHHDYAAVRAVCTEFETGWRLTRTSAGTGAAAVRPTRAETEIAARTGADTTVRVGLERVVRSAALASTGPAHFQALLGVEGVSAVFSRESEQRPGTWLGVTFHRDGHTTSAGTPVTFSGRKLARDLTAPALQARWDVRATGPDAAPGTAGALVTRLGDLLAAAAVHAQATGLEGVRAQVDAAADVLWAGADAVEEDLGGRWHEAAALAARAAREPGTRSSDPQAEAMRSLLEGLSMTPRGTTKAERELARAYAMFTRLLRAWAGMDRGEPARVAAVTAHTITTTTAARPPAPAGGRAPVRRPAASAPAPRTGPTEDHTPRRSSGT